MTIEYDRPRDYTKQPYDPRATSGPQWLTAGQHDVQQGFPPSQSSNPTMDWMRNQMSPLNQQQQQMPGMGGSMLGGRMPMMGGGMAVSGIGMNPFGTGNRPDPSQYWRNSYGTLGGGNYGRVFDTQAYMADLRKMLQPQINEIIKPRPMPTQLYGQMADVASNPGSVSGHQAFKFLQEQGMNAMNRTAAAKRMRFAGKTMLDAQRFGQDLSSTYWGDILKNLTMGAQEERNRWTDEERIRQLYANLQLGML